MSDRGGCWPSATDYRMAYPVSTPAARLPIYVPTAVISSNLVKRVFNLWDIWAKGENGMDPISAVMDYTPTLDDVRSMVVADLKMWPDLFNLQWKDGAFTSDEGSHPTGDFLWRARNFRALDVRVAGAQCLAIANTLETADFSKYGLYETLLPNPGFEATDPAILTNALYTPGTNFLPLTATQTMKGVRYQWDARGRNAAGWGEKSGKRSFVPTTAP
jgi:hypothetical protein